MTHVTDLNLHQHLWLYEWIHGVFDPQEDFLDQHIDWARAVSDVAPVERTFIQFNTNMKARLSSAQKNGQKKNTHMLHGAGIVTNICLKITQFCR